MTIQIHTVVSDPFAENSYILWKDGRTDAVVIDPGFDPQAILEFLSERGLTLAAIIDTHGHVDHIAGNAEMKHAFPDAPILVGERDAIFLTDPVVNMSAAYGFAVTSPPADRLLKEGETLDFAGIVMEVFDVPGHSPGHVVYLIRETKPLTIMGGDVLFRGSIGRVDFPGGSFEVLKTNIERVLWPLPDDSIVYPGHGPVTTVGFEKRTNPFLNSVDKRGEWRPPM